MLFNLNIYDVNLAVWGALALAQLRGQTPQAIIDTLIGTETGQPVVSFIRPADAISPLAYVGQSAGFCIVLINGTESLKQGTNILASYAGSVGAATANPTNFFNRNAAAAIWNFRSSFHMVDPLYVIVIGYSIGGAIGINLKIILGGLLPNVSVYNMSFGSPRSINSQQASTCDDGSHARWMTREDVVPFLPPRIANFPWVCVLLSGAAIYNMNNFLHTAGGILLGTDGTVSAGVLPDLVPQFPNVALASWLSGQDTNGTGPHALTEYQRRLALYVQAHPVAKDDVVGFGGGEEADGLTRREINQAERVNAHAIFAVERRQNSGPEVIPRDQVFVAARQGQVWTVYFGGQQVAVGPSKRRARKVARLGNQWLKIVQTTGIVDPAGLVSQFTAYMAQAADPNSGFSPTMNTTWPQ